MKVAARLLILLSLVSCASQNKNGSTKYIEKPSKECVKVAQMSSVGFSIIPGVGRALAKSMLEKKAEEMKANSIMLTKENGFFHVELEADGFKCRDFKEKV